MPFDAISTFFAHVSSHLFARSFLYYKIIKSIVQHAIKGMMRTTSELDICTQLAIQTTVPWYLGSDQLAGSDASLR
jgi:hypothetical protein